MRTYVVTVQATIEVDADSEAEARKKLDLGDGEIDRILCIECCDDEEK